MLKRIPGRPYLVVAILLLTAIVFTGYISNHPELRHTLGNVRPGTLALLMALYIGAVGALSLINLATIRLCNATIAPGENLLLTMYSSIINFFGPLQSGPAFRAVYLRQKHGIKFRDYTLASFVYYFFYALFSGLLLVSGILKWWLIPISLAVLIGLITLKNSNLPALRKIKHLSLENWYYMAGATLLQVALVSAIYLVELRSVAPGVHLGQALVYTGAANFALFVSLTPGAIGFRESFLLFSQKMHHIHTNTIVAASTIDRGVYLILLVVLAILILTTHARRRFAVTKGQTTT